ncbi:MAG: hypothetical protein HZB39_19625 [Planctomycetes bacterium]|nr:hypothetical protein [Planctomycetota bacterium]
MGPRTVLGVLLLTTSLAAHGGVYRGPTSPPFLPGPGGPPTPATPTGGPNTPGPSDPSGLTSLDGWQFWWEYNKDHWLALRETVLGPRATAPADGWTRSGAIDRRPSEAELIDRVIPAIVRSLDSTSSPDVSGAGIVALAKIGRTHPSIDVPAQFENRLGRGSLEVRETAALTLGLCGLAEVFEDLVQLATDSGAGRKLAGRTPIEERVRAFAIHGLGLAAHGSADVAVKRRVFAIASAVLDERTLADRDVAAAALNAIGVLALDAGVAEQKRLLWESVAVLEKFLARDLGRGDEVVQAHAPTAIARLLGRGTSNDHRRISAAWLDALAARRRSDNVLQSMAQALGELVPPRERGEEWTAVSETLEKVWADSRDQGTRYFALMALASIGGEANRAFLLRELPRGQKGTERPWLALALGVLARGELERGGAPDTAAAALLLRTLREVENDDVRAASAIALGLMKHQPAIDEMLRLLVKHRRRDQLAGYLCVALGMIGDVTAVPTIAAVLDEAEYRPSLLAQAAIGFGLLDPIGAGQALASMLRKKDESVGRLAGIALAFRYIGDRRAIDPLLGLLGEKDLPDLARAFVLAAVGGACDRGDLPWNEAYARCVNYRAPIATISNGVTGILDIL